MTRKYSWREGFRSKVDAEDFGKVYEHLAATLPVVKTKDILDAARDPKSTLYPAFEWDDAKAAESHRLQQARQMAGALVVTRVRIEERGVESVKALHSVRQAGQKTGYALESRIASSNDLRAQVLASAKRDLTALLRKFSSLSEMTKLIPKLEDLIGGIQDDLDTIEMVANRRRKPAARHEDEVGISPDL